MNVDKFGIYGSTGYLGRAILNKFANSVALNREDFTSTKIVIDCSFPRNYMNTKIAEDYENKIVSRSKDCERRKIKYIYVGSYSSISPVTSVYGRIKKNVENITLVNGGTVLKSGLVMSTENPQGRYHQFLSAIEKFPFLVTPSPTTFRIHTTWEKDLLDSLKHDALYQENGVFLLEATEISDLNTLVANLELNKKIYELSPYFSKIMQNFVHFFPSRYFDSLKSIANIRTTDQLGHTIIPRG